ncbi:MAG: hypothetical protein IPN20_00555 [Haliscomenobacter sp.]|nr:hypothetical protein [Haliscomenobacter sp.]
MKLSWEYPYDPLLHEFAVYRSDNGGPMRLVRYLELSAFPPVAVVEAGRGYFVLARYANRAGQRLPIPGCRPLP